MKIYKNSLLPKFNRIYQKITVQLKFLQKIQNQGLNLQISNKQYQVSQETSKIKKIVIRRIQVVNLIKHKIQRAVMKINKQVMVKERKKMEMILKKRKLGN